MAAVTLATTNEPVIVPAEIEHAGDEMEPLLPAIVQAELVEAKPEPDTVTVAPACAELGFTVMDGVEAVSWKLAVAESPAGLPVAVTS